MNTTSIEAVVRDLCARIAHVGQACSYEERVGAAIVLIRRFTGIEPQVVPVRAALFSRSAVFLLGSAIMPAHDGEVAQFREQVGPAMILLGGDHPHVVLIVGTVMVELSDARAWNDRGVLLRPFVADRPRDTSRWTVDRLRYGVHVAYERNDAAAPISMSVAAYRLATQIERDLADERRVRRAN